MKKTYLFYDIETTGLNKAFDQVLQFAAIRTDEDFKELERHEVLIKLNPDVIPSPGAILTHNIGISDIAKGKPEFEGIKEIHQLMNTPGTISLGYNTLGFDDEFLRFSFFRNLLTPYSHQYANNCGRVDIYPMTIMYYLFKNEALEWPVIDGKTTMRLEHLNASNNLATGSAHDAIVDVEATLALAKRLKSFPDMWDYLIEYFDKEQDHQRTAKLTDAFSIQHHTFKEGLMIDGSFGAKQKYQSIVLCLGRHNHYKNQSLWLRLDSGDLSKTKADNINEHAWVVKKKPGEPGLLLPTTPRFLTHIDDERKKLVAINLQWIQSNPEIFQQLIDYHRDFTYSKIANIDPDAALYQMGFLLPHETQLCAKFHQQSLDEKVAMIKKFHNPVLREQAIRIIGRLAPEKLTDSLRDEFDNYVSSIQSEHHGLDYKGGNKLSPHQALDEINEIRKNKVLNAEQHTLLNELEEYISKSFTPLEISE